MSEQKQNDFDYKKFEEDLLNGAGVEPFRNDLQQVRYHKISRFPALTITDRGKKGVLIVGYRPYPVLLQAIAQVAPHLQAVQQATDVEEYKSYWGTVTDREMKEALMPASAGVGR